jgi:hypothetical protein
MRAFSELRGQRTKACEEATNGDRTVSGRPTNEMMTWLQENAGNQVTRLSYLGTEDSNHCQVLILINFKEAPLHPARLKLKTAYTATCKASAKLI